MTKTYSKLINFSLILAILFSPVFCIAPTQAQAQASIEFLDIKVEKQGRITHIQWLTNVVTQGRVIFGEDSEHLPYFVVDNTSPAKYHDIAITTPKEETDYYYKIIAHTDTEQAESFVRKFKTGEFGDHVPPQISKVKIAYIAGTAMAIEWETDKEASSRIEYDDDKTYIQKVGSNTRVTSHRVIIKNLIPDNVYYLRIYSVDADSNQSSFHYREFKTRVNDTADNEDLIISYLRPNSSSDPYISADNVFVGFTTNHYAKGSAVLRRVGSLSQSNSLDYSLNHSTVFTGLSSDSEYRLDISMVDIFGKKIEIKDLYIKTKGRYQGSNNTNIIVAGTQGAVCTAETLSAALNQTGYYGEYYNLSRDTANIDTPDYGVPAKENGWFSEESFAFSRIEENINFGMGFLPIKEKKYPKDPYYFGAYWITLLDVPQDGFYDYVIDVDNSGWIYLDQELITDLGKRLPRQKEERSVFLTQGYHVLEIYFAERGPGQSGFSFILDKDLKAHPWTSGCTLSGPNQNVVINEVNNNEINVNNNGIEVLGAEYSRYTPASALYKTPESPDIYAIVNNQRYYISSPASFNEYGYSWDAIKTVSRQELEQYPRARLIKSPDSPTIYYLYQRPEDQWLKIAIPSPTAFVSYSDNYWGNIITVTELDVNSYPDAKLIKAANDPAVYYLENNTKHQISEQVFKQKQFSQPEIVIVSQVHLDTYRTGEAWR